MCKSESMNCDSADQHSDKENAERKKIDFERSAGIRTQETRAMRCLLRAPVKKIRQSAEKTT